MRFFLLYFNLTKFILFENLYTSNPHRDPLDRMLIDQIQFFMRALDDIGKSSCAQSAHERGTHQPLMPCDINLAIQLHVLLVIVVGGITEFLNEAVALG